MSEEKGAGEANATKLKQQKLEELYLRIANSLNIKGTAYEKYKKSITGEPNGEACRGIVDDKEECFFFVIQNSAESVTVLKECPPLDNVGKAKRALVFVKLWEEALEMDTIGNMVHFEINKNPLDLLYQLCNEIYVPVLHNPQNQQGWTELISKDLMEK
jgi:dynein heavy chain